MVAPWRRWQVAWYRFKKGLYRFVDWIFNVSFMLRLCAMFDPDMWIFLRHQPYFCAGARAMVQVAGVSSYPNAGASLACQAYPVGRAVA